MTDEERRKLLPGLRRAAYILQQYWEPDAIVPAFDDVQNEIKRIETNSAALAQSDAEPFPQPQRNDGGEPCGECHLQMGETCDVCGAKAQSDAEPSNRVVITTQAELDDFLNSETEPPDRSGPADYIPIGGAGNGA